MKGTKLDKNLRVLAKLKKKKKKEERKKRKKNIKPSQFNPNTFLLIL